MSHIPIPVEDMFSWSVILPFPVRPIPFPVTVIGQILYPAARLNATLLPYPCRRGGIRPPPLRFFHHNSKTPGAIEKKLSDFNFTPLIVILHILSITIVITCCHSSLLFPVCHIILWVEKQGNLNYFQDNYLIKLKFGREGYF